MQPLSKFYYISMGIFVFFLNIKLIFHRSKLSHYHQITSIFGRAQLCFNSYQNFNWLVFGVNQIHPLKLHPETKESVRKGYVKNYNYYYIQISHDSKYSM